MIEYVKENKWVIILISFIIINIVWMVYSHDTKKDVIQLDESSYSLEQKVYEENGENIIIGTKAQEVVQSLEILDKNNPITTSVTPPMIEEAEIQEVPIYICGEVKNPGVYYVSTHAIINDIVEKSGGFTDEANQMAVNLASQIVPNEKIIVPKIGEEIDKLIDSYDNRERIESSSVSLQATINQTPLINLNTATKEQLMALNGIGEMKAAAIIAYRQEKGAFSSVDELKNISGIGDKTFEKIKQFIIT